MNSHANTINNTTAKGSTPALLALAISAFGIGTTEFVPVGLLSSIADNLSISIPLVGLLISGYAIGVAIGAPVLTALTSKVSRKSLLMSLMLLFIIGNSAAALSTSFELLLVARFITAFSQCGDVYLIFILCLTTCIVIQPECSGYTSYDGRAG